MHSRLRRTMTVAVTILLFAMHSVVSVASISEMTKTKTSPVVVFMNALTGMADMDGCVCPEDDFSPLSQAMVCEETCCEMDCQSLTGQSSAVVLLNLSSSNASIFVIIRPIIYPSLRLPNRMLTSLYRPPISFQ